MVKETVPCLDFGREICLDLMRSYSYQPVMQQHWDNCREYLGTEQRRKYDEFLK